MFQFMEKQRWNIKKSYTLHFAHLLIFICGLIVIMVSACSQDMPTATLKSHSSTVAASINFPEQTQLTPIDSLRLDVTGENIDAQHYNLELDGTTALQQITVPSEKEITLNATAYHQGQALLQGKQTFTAKSGENVNLELSMEFMASATILTPPDTTVSVGDTTNVFVNVRHVENLSRIGVLIEFPTNLLQVVQMEEIDSFLLQDAKSVIPNQFSANNTSGQIIIKLRVTPASAAPSGNGRIARIAFRAQRNGRPDIQVILQSATDPELGLFDENDNPVTAYAFGSRIIIE